MTILIFIVILAILVFVHEFGHFIAARACGIRVDAFALGFGPRIFSWKFKNKTGKSVGFLGAGETEYSIRLIPFGGFVKIFGENPDEENTHGPEAKRSFVNKPKWQQVIVLASGVLCNFIFAFILYICVFSGGVTASIDGFEQYARYFTNERIMIIAVEPNSPAYKAGIRTGDSVLGSTSIEEIQNNIQNSAGLPVELHFLSHDKELNIAVTPMIDQSTTTSTSSVYKIGIGMRDVYDMHLPVYISIWQGFRYTFFMIKDTAIGLVNFIGSIFAGTADYSQISGPVGIAVDVGDAAALGFSYLVMFTAIISVNLGVINLIPFPALDGGRIFVVIIEAIIRRPVSPKYINVINLVGFVLLMALMVFVTYKDILKLFHL